jgi:hypothetical protein
MKKIMGQSKMKKFEQSDALEPGEVVYSEGI